MTPLIEKLAKACLFSPGSPYEAPRDEWDMRWDRLGFSIKEQASQIASSFIDALQEETGVDVRAGWQLVPKEPTKEIFDVLRANGCFDADYAWAHALKAAAKSP